MNNNVLGLYHCYTFKRPWPMTLT